MTTTTAQPLTRPRWVLAVLTALIAVGALFLAAGTASAATAPTAENRIRASSIAAQTLDRPPQDVSADQRLGNGPSQPGIVVATGVAANTAAKAADDAPIAWPPNNGFHGELGPHANPGVTVLKPGTLVDRFGFDGGRFVAPNGTSIGGRALAPGTTDKPYSVFEVTNRLVVQHGPAEPWFGQPGMGTQYYLPSSVDDLLNAGYLRRVG